jgi:methanogenic corrinoid protein MtbC1
MGSHVKSGLGEQYGALRCSKTRSSLFPGRAAANQERLASVIYNDIVPRLHMLHHELSAENAERAFTREEIFAFGGALISPDNLAADQFLQTMRARGHSEATLSLGLMAETARHLGALWEEDRCNFVEVTIGVARLQKMLRVSSGVCEPAFAGKRQRVILCALTREQHVFGVDMVACFLRHAYWDVDLRKGVDAQHVSDAVSREWFAVLGFTLSAQSGLEALCRAVQSGRAASVNSAIGILVGGPLFRRHPDLAAQVGADAVAADAASASLLAKKLLLRQEIGTASQSDHGAPREARISACLPAAESGAQSAIQSSNASNVLTADVMTARS